MLFTQQSHTEMTTITEVKLLKQLVRNIVDPTRDLGHVDRKQNKSQSHLSTAGPVASTPADQLAEQGSEEVSKMGETTIPTDPDAAVAIAPP